MVHAQLPRFGATAGVGDCAHLFFHVQGIPCYTQRFARWIEALLNFLLCAVIPVGQVFWLHCNACELC